jgi:hypothetical protein
MKRSEVFPSLENNLRKRLEEASSESGHSLAEESVSA